jgi:hypothetical protein
MDDPKRGTRKKRMLSALFVLAMGLLPFLKSLDNPHLAGLRGPDILPLIAIGMSVGLALGILVGERVSS